MEKNAFTNEELLEIEEKYSKVVSRSVKILIADASVVKSRITASVLNKVGYKNIETIKSIKELLLLRKKKEAFGLFFIDIELPQITAAIIKSIIDGDEQTPPTPVIILGETFSKENVSLIVAAGAKKFLKKPVSAETLEPVVSMALQTVRIDTNPFTLNEAIIDNWISLTPKGELNKDSGPVINKKIKALLKEDCLGIAIDISLFDNIDDLSLRFFNALQKSCEAADKNFIIIDAYDRIDTDDKNVGSLNIEIEL